MNSENDPHSATASDSTKISPTMPAASKRNRAAAIKGALVAWASGAGLVILPTILIPLLIYRAREIDGNPVAKNWLEFCLFIGAGYLLFSKRGSANFRLAAEVTIWLATANYLILKYFTGLPSYFLAGSAIISSLVVAYRRAET